MNGRYILVFVTTVMFLLAGMVGAVNLEKNITTKTENQTVTNDADVPTWNIGDRWIYYGQLSLDQSEYFNLDFSLYFNNLEFEVIDILNNEDMYKLKVTIPQGDLSGNGNVELSIFSFSGQISNAKLDGFIYIDKSTLEINKFEGTIQGDTDKILLPTFKVEFDVEFEKIINNALIKTSFSPVLFPINVNQHWNIPVTYVNVSANVIKPNLGKQRLYSYTPEHLNFCEKWDIVETDENDFDSLKMYGEDYGDKSNIWYSPAAGNIVKIQYDDVDLGISYHIDSLNMQLISTNYQADSNPPETPEKPSGDTNFLAGETATYTTSTTDPDGDKIRYIFDWDDGTEQTHSDFAESNHLVEVEHMWGIGGTHNVKVKARDKYGYESDWSEPLAVTVINNQPTAPEKPEGTTRGSYKKTHDYTTKSTDEDGHQIRYGWDWDGDDDVDQWTNYVDENTESTTSHKWSSKGDYVIKVKAEDEYGMQSEWSEPLSVTMPKNYDFSSHPFLKFLQRIQILFPNIQLFNWLINIIEGKLI